MVIYQEMECEECGKTSDVVEIKKNGKKVCKDTCVGISKGEGIKYLEVTEEGQVLQEIVKDLLKRDLNRIYYTNKLEGTDALNSIRSECGGFDSKKVYYQNNDIDLVIEMQERAYDALTYMEMGREDYRGTAETVYKLYKEARQKRFTEEDIKRIKEIMGSVEVRCIEAEVR